MKFRLGLVLAVVALVAMPGLIHASTMMSMKTVKVTMNALGGSGQSGTATIAATKGGHIFTIDLNGEPKGASEPAHIHPGTCAKPNPIPKVALKNVVDGRSVTTVPSMGSMSGSWSILVHMGSSYAACGDIPKM